MRFPRLPVVAAVTAVTLALAPSALASPSPAAGVREYNQKVCDRDWVSVHIPKVSYYNVYPGTFGAGAHTCVDAEEYHLDFAVSSASGSGFHAYPNISSGWESGRYSCTGHRGACYRYPVQVKDDGDPVTSMAAWLAPGRYDLSWDIWTNATDSHPVQDSGATELMVWLAHPGIREAVDRTVVIGGIAWDVTTWMCHRNGATWRLLIYYAVRQRSSVNGLRLNDFFREAERHGEMSARYWLTGIDAGFELVSGGVHDNVHRFSLTGLPATEGGR